ncbi:uncharacterized protein K444DRAFT_609686 [Hyaloscypha bicolor E]|uniref:Uncharacterized protein n=1 Tax=Hyaloscypha bicolor E TaxID=1095630 RepID=A0A2J6TKG1_9HELO|nr:uncharacterized protein K444DRAFT_609686 [Hyaloscypha bicolor E]PMD63478.1 hypothetical protein K444DRAFT_609686 [Hyaloscypha bicolor E]
MSTFALSVFFLSFSLSSCFFALSLFQREGRGLNTAITSTVYITRMETEGVEA